MNEEELLFDKTYTCPVCGKEFKNRTVKAGKVRPLRTERNLRPVYDQFEPLKYGVVMCPACGYAALGRYFGSLLERQKKAIMQQITAAYKPPKEEKSVYSYEDALGRYKMALLNATVKGAKASEKSYICMKTAWLLSSEGENLPKDGADYESKKAEIDKQEERFMRNALDGFLEARMKEDYPICGMDEPSMDYLLVTMEMRFGEYDVASKLLAKILTSHSASPRIKDKARDLKDVLAEKMQ